MLNILKLFFVKKQKAEFPHEFFIIRFNELAKKYGIFDDIGKEIEHHNGNSSRKYQYSEEKVETMHEEGRIPYIDETTEEFKLTISKKINPQIVQYEQEVKDGRRESELI